MISPEMLRNLISTTIASTSALRASSNRAEVTLYIQVDTVPMTDEIGGTFERPVAQGTEVWLRV